MTILFDFTFLENDLSFFIVKQNRHAPAKWHRKRVRKGCFEKRSTKNYARRAISILKHPFARVRKGAFEKNYEKLRAKGYFNFKTPFAHARKGLFEKNTKNYARKAISILLPLSAHARKGLLLSG